MNSGTLKSWAWKIFTLPIIGIVYITLISEGLRLLIPVLGQKLYKFPLPFVSAMRNYHPWDRLDLAYFFSILLLIAVWYLWKVTLKVYLSYEGQAVPPGWDPAKYRGFVLTIAVIILSADAFLFYFAMTQQVYWKTQFSFTALLATGAYICVLLCSYRSFPSILNNLQRRYDHEHSSHSSPIPDAILRHAHSTRRRARLREVPRR